MKEFYRLLDRLVRQPAVVGSETHFFQFLTAELKRAGAKKVVQYEGMLAVEGAQPDTQTFSAHVDRHGLMCTGPNEVQYAAFVAGFKGWQTGDTISELSYQNLAGRFNGEAVYAFNPWTGKVLAKGKILGASLCDVRNDVLFRTEGLEKLMAGTPIAYVDKVEESDKHHVNAQLDNVLSVALLVYLYKLGYQGRAFFTAQEEIGRSWRYLLEWFQREKRDTNDLVVLDISSFPDSASAEAQQVVLRHRDASAEFHAPTVGRIQEACEAEQVTFAFKDDLLAQQSAASGKPASLGRTELGRLIAGSNQKVTGATLQIPTTGYHTAAESTAKTSVEAALRVMAKLGSVKLPRKL